jgi:hypothetical protein
MYSSVTEHAIVTTDGRHILLGDDNEDDDPNKDDAVDDE